MAEALCAKMGLCPILRVEFDNRTLMDETRSSLFGSSFRPNWRESGVQLTKKQVVLLMHNTLPQGIKSVCALLQKKVVQ